MKTKFAIGCLVQWYEIEMIGEYIESLKQSIDYIKNKDNLHWPKAEKKHLINGNQRILIYLYFQKLNYINSQINII